MRRNKLETTVFITFEERLHLLPNHPGQSSILEESSCRQIWVEQPKLWPCIAMTSNPHPRGLQDSRFRKAYLLKMVLPATWSDVQESHPRLPTTNMEGTIHREPLDRSSPAPASLAGVRNGYRYTKGAWLPQTTAECSSNQGLRTTNVPTMMQANCHRGRSSQMARTFLTVSAAWVVAVCVEGLQSADGDLKEETAAEEVEQSDRAYRCARALALWFSERMKGFVGTFLLHRARGGSRPRPTPAQDDMKATLASGEIGVVAASSDEYHEYQARWPDPPLTIPSDVHMA